MTHITVFVFFNHFLIVDIDFHSILIVQRDIVSWISSVFLSEWALLAQSYVWFFGCGVAYVSYLRSLTLVTTDTWKTYVVHFLTRGRLFGDHAWNNLFIFMFFFLDYLVLKVWIQSFLTSTKHSLGLWNCYIVLADRISLNNSSHNFSSMFDCSLSCWIITFFKSVAHWFIFYNSPAFFFLKWTFLCSRF